MSTITKEWLKQKIADMEATRDEIPFGLDEDDSNMLAALRIALASLEAETSTDNVSDAELNAALLLHRLKVNGHSQLSDAFRAGFKYARRTSPPIPVSVPDERYQHLSELYHAQEKRLFKLAQRIKGRAFDKYSHSPSQAIDVLEAAIFGEDEGACRAAMLHGAENAESTTTMQNAPALDSSPKIAESTSGNSPVIPDGWVACSERMPDKLIPVMVMYADGEMWSAIWTGMKWDDGTEFPDPHAVTHWQEMPAAPQQEVK